MSAKIIPTERIESKILIAGRTLRARNPKLCPTHTV